MKILILNQAFYPDVVATAQQASDLAAALVERGHEVTVLCGRRAYDSPGTLYPRREIWRGVRIRRISSLGLGKKARWRRAANFASYLANCVLGMLPLARFDVVLALTSPPLISYLGAWFARWKGGRFVSWVMDLNPDEAIAAGWLREDSSTASVLQAMLRYSLRRADLIVALDRFMADRIEAKGITREKIEILPPWPQDHMVRYDVDGRERFRKQHGLDGKYVVMYSGNHSPCHPLGTLLEAARHLAARPEITFCFVGGGSEFVTVQRFAAEHRLSNVMTLPYQPFDQVSASLSAADLHAVVMGDAFVGILHPCKVYNIRALGIPYLYIGPQPSPISELNPPFESRHGDVAGVVRHLEAVTAARRESSRVAAGHDELVANLVDFLERKASDRAFRPTEDFSEARRGLLLISHRERRRRLSRSTRKY